uniref:Phosphate-specific transport system accessory protein PhoU n=1 Tax=uncultured marine group II/III euryarchaeote KM3_153_G11 TaxID=1457896 RepID=A0A075GJP0_9EURY|nr:phosphate transport system regulatory protein (phoU) [uncultured marine group II/III euryarchaeote KM3_153_G11]
MPRVDLDHQLHLLHQEVGVLAGMVEKAIARAVEALKERDLEESRQVVQEDDYIDQKRFEIEDRCVDLIATQQPMATDLRAIIALLHITVELERMGDYAEGIAKISLMMGEAQPLKPLIDIPRMAEKAIDMLRDSMDALVSRDVVKAHQVCQADDEVDALYDQVYRELLLFMIQDPQTIERATFLLWVAHDLERIADRATNIAERVIFLVTGKMVEINVSRY